MCGGVESRVFFQIIFLLVPSIFCWSCQISARSPLGRVFVGPLNFSLEALWVGERERASKQWEANFSFSLLVFLGLKYPLHTKTYERKSGEKY